MPPDTQYQEIASALKSSRESLTRAAASAFECTEKWSRIAAKNSVDYSNYLTTNFQVFGDYLVEYYARQDTTFKHLFIGEAIKALHDPNLSARAAQDQTMSIACKLFEGFRKTVETKLSPVALSLFDKELTGVHEALTADVANTMRILFVGDCLFLDIVAFVAPSLILEGVRIIPEYATSKNSALLHDQLRGLSERTFDLVFFSPFSYEFSLEFSQLQRWRQSLSRTHQIEDAIQKAWESTQQTLDLISGLFDCAIHIHNSAAIVLEENSAKRAIKSRLSSRVRRTAKARINALVADYIQGKNQETFTHLFLFDENREVQKFGELKAGAFFYKTPLQHPAVLGKILANSYRNIIFTHAFLLKKKVVVCDLDNTLWDGVIGEGAVVHFHDRQQILKALTSKGVVLAINSKNDPANVHWRGGTLQDKDFVSSAISWGPKVNGMARIQDDLNLKIKDYVFVDDREDERELMRISFPETLCVDAVNTETWQRFSLWESLLDPDPGMDRTLMYQQREERKAFIKEDVVTDEDRSEMFASLQLKLQISVAQQADLKRVTELINRTNQFNLEGSRTTVREVAHWHASSDYIILLGKSSDRFGEMGTTCIAVAKFDADRMYLLPFVLSCRVFGYGIERCLMNHLLTLARSRGVKTAVGRYVATPQNGPCKSFLADSGFISTGDVWEFNTDCVEAPTPQWLEITT
jgi:FkbH-like protein